jgi:acetyltransferase-like isoleucine patch superfamily enzyme
MRTIGNNVRIEIEGGITYFSDFDDDEEIGNLPIEDNVTIGDNTIIRTKHLHIGFGTVIEENCKIFCKDSFDVGDNCFIGHDAKILVPEFKCGDYVELHNHLFCNGECPCVIGSNVWIGQNDILNARAPLTIGNGVGIGTYSCVWTHGMHGELLEGCTVYKVAPVVIEDDAWIVGSFNVIATGLTIGKKCIILSGSQVTKNVPANTVWGGDPAVDITAKLRNPPYKTITVDEKYEMMKKFVEEFYVMYPEYTGQIQFIPKMEFETPVAIETKIIVTKTDESNISHSDITIFDLTTKRYNKQRTPIEIAFIKSLLYEKARFLPW